MCKKCVSEKMRTKIELVQTVAGDWNDGAFLAFCEEQGVDATDLEAYYDEHKPGGKNEKKE